MTYPVEMSEEDWRRRLTRREYAVLREGAELVDTGEYLDTTAVGVYVCRACGANLFRSEAKFDSRCGWPSFYAPHDNDAVQYVEDTSHGMLRTEVRCASCGSHLGHVFEGEGFRTPTDLRYCVNSITLTLETAD